VHLSGIMNAETEKKAERILTDVDFAASHLPSLSEDLTEIKLDSLKLGRKLDQLVNMSEFSGRMRDKRTGLLGGPVPTDTGCGVIRLNHVFPRLLLFCGCGTTPAVPEDGFHQLEPMPPSVPVPQPGFPQGLQVASASADPLRGRRAVLYR